MIPAAVCVLRGLLFVGITLSVTAAAAGFRSASASTIIGTVSASRPTAVADLLAFADHPESDVGITLIGITSDSAGFGATFRAAAVPCTALDRTLIANST